jgi:hypothetical protein
VKREFSRHASAHAARLLIALPIPSQDVPELLKAALKVVVAAEQALEGPEDVAQKTTA